ncbi:MAG: HAD family hydrolase [Euryarchaeota archaeon]|nr:HAD family hydrolase [Euryarchaeota archaeon]
MNLAYLSGRPIKAVVLDFDGTLVHSTVDFSKMKHKLIDEMRNMGIPKSALDPSITVTENMENIHSFLISSDNSVAWETVECLASEMMENAEMENVHLTRPIKGAKETILKLKHMGFKVGMLTRGSRRYATAAIKYAGLDGIIDKQMFRDDNGEREAKPNPISLHRMANSLGLPVRKCLMVGDHSIDSICANSAGAAFIGVLTGSFTEEDWKQFGCYYTNSVADLPTLLSR